MFWVLNIFSKVHLPLKYWKVLQNLSNYVCQYCVRKLQFGHWKCIVQMCSQAEVYHAFFSTLLKKFQFYYFCFQFVIGITYSESFFFFFPWENFSQASNCKHVLLTTKESPKCCVMKVADAGRIRWIPSLSEKFSGSRCTSGKHA